jgi:hypothetical protein
VRVFWIRETVWKRSASSWEVRSERRGRTRCGETRMWPGRRGLRFTRAKEWGVVWKTYRVVSAWGCGFGGGGDHGRDPTWEVTVKGPNLMSLFVRDAIFLSW